MQEEIWKDIEEFEGFYQVSNLGRVRRIFNKKYFIRKPSLNIYGYYQVRLSKQNNVKTRLVHRLVALAFIPNKLNKSEINHKNAIKTDNRVENLEWCTRQENQEHVKNNNLYPQKYGLVMFYNKLTKNDVDYIRANYIPRSQEFSYGALAKKFNVCRHTIMDIVLRRSWNG